MELNIFQKIAFLIYISIFLLICVYFVPYEHYSTFYSNTFTFHSNIFHDSQMSYFRFLIYLSIPTLLFCFIFRSLEKKNALKTSVFKKKAKTELYIFFLFASAIIVTVLFLYGKNEYSEIRKDTLANEISVLRNGIKEVDKSQYYRFKVYSEIPYIFLGLTWSEEAFYSHIDYTEGFVSIVYDFLKENKMLTESEAIFNSCIRAKTPYEISTLENKRTELQKELKDKSKNLKKITSYGDEAIRYNISIAFLTLLILLYVSRLLFSMLNGMLKEVS